MINYSITDSGLALLVLLILGTLIGLAISAKIPNEPWPYDILERDDGHGWEEEKW